jgi:two-component system OmpR family response regulator
MHAAPRILIVDDDAELCRSLAVDLRRAGIESTLAASGSAALAQLEQRATQPIDAILLDVVMPGKSGWELLEELRQAGDEIPVLVLSGRCAPDERVHGLRLGADDYIAKPFHFEELVERIHAVLRRRHSLPPLAIGEMTLDLVRRKCVRAGKTIELSPREFDLLLALARAGGDVLTRKQLLEEVWDMRFDPGTNILDVHLGRLRRKLDRHGRPAIETVRGEGYRISSQNLGVQHGAAGADETRG